MARAINLALVLAMVALVGCVSESMDLQEYCMGLRRQMSSNPDVYKNAEAAFREAKKHLDSFLSLSMISRSKLARAWEAVIKDADCNENSADIVSTIVQCNPGARNEMATLLMAARRYSNKCLTPEFWDRQLKKTMGKFDRSGLTEFINDEFLEQYRADNAGERALHFSVIGGPNCCEPERSHKALLRVLRPIMGVDEGAIKEMAHKNRQKFENILQINLFKPCESYKKFLDPLMRQASHASEYKYGGTQAFVDEQSQEFKDALFRYKYCANFQYLDGANAKLGEINVRKFV